MIEIEQKLIFLYGEEKGRQTFAEIQKLVADAKSNIHTTQREYFNEKDSILITYADSFSLTNRPPLQTLHTFLNKYLKDTINTVHILPFFPFSSDRGFSIIDFTQVKQEFGTWDDIATIAQKKRLMADLVLNHVSTQSMWFQKFLQGDPDYQNYFISFSDEELTPELRADLQKVFRPRTTPLLTPFITENGIRHVWTTFSVGTTTDQVDLNYQNPKVLIEMIKIIFDLLKKGVQLIRLDAVTYVWKKNGTNSIHLAEGHTIVQLMRDLLNDISPSTLLITETNVPHKENISYFGNGHDEAQMVYNFALPPLVLHALQTGNAAYLTNWAKTLTPPSKETTFFNFLASHDGIGMLGAQGIIPGEEIQSMCKAMENNGAKVSYRTLPDGGKSAYEVCATWWSAVTQLEEHADLQLQKFITSIAISFALAGIPGIYYLSLFGKENDVDGFEKTGHTRDINRENLELTAIEEALSRNESKEQKVFEQITTLLKQRTSHPAFHPNAPQLVLDLDKRIFALLRKSPQGDMLTLHNISGDEVSVTYEDKTHTVLPYSFLWKPLSQ